MEDLKQSKWVVLKKNLSFTVHRIKKQTHVNLKNSKKISFQKIFEENEAMSQSDQSHVHSKRTFDKLTTKFNTKHSTSSIASNLDSHMIKYLFETNKARKQSHGYELPTLNMLRKYSDRNYLFNYYFEQSQNVKFENEIRYENTYRMGPTKLLDPVVVEFHMNALLDKFLNIVDLNEVMSSRSAIKTSLEHLTTTVKGKIKPLVDKRYKLIVHCSVLELNYQGVCIGSRCLWNSDTDLCVSINKSSKNYVILTNLYAVYFE